MSARNDRKQGGFTEILLVVVILVAAVAAGAYYLGRGTIKPQPSPAPITQTLPTPPTSSLKVSEEIVNWKTYTNKQYNFLIKYPPTYILADNLPSTRREWSPEKTLSIKNQNIPEEPTLIVEVNADGYGSMLSDTKQYTLKLINNKIEIVSKKDQDIKNIEAMTGETFSFTRVGTNFIQHNNNYFNFKLIIKDLDNKKLGNELDQILSTFKFTN